MTDPNAGERGAQRAMARIAVAWPGADLGDARLAKIAAADAEKVLSLIPASAVDRAVTRFIGGEVGDPRWPPKLAELAAEARRILAADVAATKARRAWERPKALPAPPRSPEEIARRRAQADEARRLIADARLKEIPIRDEPARTGVEPEVEPPAAVDPDERLRELAAQPLPQLSPHAAAIVARQMRSAG